MREHVQLDTASQHLVCHHCGATERLCLPSPLEALATHLQQFTERHAACPTPTMAPVVKPPRPAPATTTQVLFAWPGLAAWLDEGDIGQSSLAMAQAISGIALTDDDSATPWDADDFQRCVALLERVPSFAQHLNRVAGLSPAWAALINVWPELQSALPARDVSRATLSPRARANRDVQWSAVSDRVREIVARDGRV
jgi:hypothetical protein